VGGWQMAAAPRCPQHACGEQAPQIKLGHYLAGRHLDSRERRDRSAGAMSARRATVRNRPDLRITYDSPETTRAEQVRFVAPPRCVDCAACIASRGPASPQFRSGCAPPCAPDFL
jgi:hypothetical protein